MLLASTDATESAPAPNLSSEPRLRVLHLVCGTAFAGTEKHVLALALNLRELGCEVEIACPRGARELRSQASASGLSLSPLIAFRAGGEKAPDVVHVHDGRSAIVGAVIATLTGAALVRTQHFVRPASAERTGPLGQLSVRAHRLINRRLDGYVCVSEAAARAARDRRDVTSLAPAVIAPGVSILTSSQAQDAAAARAAARRPTVLSAGRLEPERRFDVLLDAIPAVLRELPDCEFLIAGTGSAETELKARARSLGIDEAVTWSGWLPDLSPALARAHVYVNTWPFEGFGMATAEAMGAGLAVVVTDSGASPELVEDRVSGRLVAPLDPHELAATLVELLSDRERAATIGAAARERAVARYSSHATAESTLALYRQLSRVRAGG